MNHASYFGHSFTVVTDHAKARPWLEDLVRIHGAGNCRGVRCIDWYVTDMIEDTTAVADDAAAACLQALKDDQAEVVILGCTIIGGCLEREIMTTGRHRDLPILNPNLLALKAAETLADLHRMGKYTISRVGPLPAPRAARRRPRPRGPPALPPGRSRSGREPPVTARVPRARTSRRSRRSPSGSSGLPGHRAGRAVRDRRGHADGPRRSRPNSRARHWSSAATRSS